MTVKADWGATTDALPAAATEVDPFAASDSAEMDQPRALKPATAKKPLDMSDSVEDLRAWLGELLRREGNLWECGTTCPLREQADSNCNACPVSRAHETSVPGQEFSVEDERMKRLCRIGAEQERVCMLLLAKRHGV